MVEYGRVDTKRYRTGNSYGAAGRALIFCALLFSGGCAQEGAVKVEPDAVRALSPEVKAQLAKELSAYYTRESRQESGKQSGLVNVGAVSLQGAWVVPTIVSAALLLLVLWYRKRRKQNEEVIRHLVRTIENLPEPWSVASKNDSIKQQIQHTAPKSVERLLHKLVKKEVG